MNGGERNRVGMGGIKETLLGVKSTMAGLRAEVMDIKLKPKDVGKPKVKDAANLGVKVAANFNLTTDGVNKKIMDGVRVNQRGIKLTVMMVVGGKRAMLAGVKQTASGKPVDVHHQTSGPLGNKNRRLTAVPTPPWWPELKWHNITRLKS